MRSDVGPSADAAMPAGRPTRGPEAAETAVGGRILRRTVAALSLTQLLGWGTTYYLPAILADPIASGTGVPRALVFGGVTIMMTVAASIAPWVGRRLDRDGTRNAMTAGSLMTALGLTILAAAHGPVLFVLAWVVIGLAAPLALTQAATTAMVQVADQGGARRAITLMSLFTGLSSTASWPVLAGLDAAIGWRASVIVYASFHLLVAAPLHWTVLPPGSGRQDRPMVSPAGRSEHRPEAPPRPVPGAFGLSVCGFGLAGVVSWGLPLHAVSILQDFGYPATTAVALGVVLGPAQTAARLIDLLGGRRLGILETGVAASAVMPFAILALMGGSSPSFAIAFAVGFGLSAGTMTIVRAVAPLRLFGREAFAVVTGRMALPLNTAFAVAPLLFAVLSQALGPYGLLAAAFAASVASFAALTILQRHARIADPDA